MNLQDDLNRGLQQLRTLKEEIQLEAHLAGMEVKTRWTEELEPLLEDAERAVEQKSAHARKQVNDAIARWRTFYEALGSVKRS